MNIIFKFFALGCLYLGFIENIDGFKNIIMFLCWFLFFASILIQWSKTPFKKSNKMEIYISRFTSFLVLITLIYFSFFSTAVVYLLSIFLVFLKRESLEKETANATN